MYALGSGDPYLVPQQKGAETIRILQPLASLDLLSDWMGYCREQHSRGCGLMENPSPVASISTFKLVDCRARQLVPWSGQPFATLSYVWGVGSKAPPFSYQLPDVLPNTIEDAIVVTLALNIGHLWVDRYCINQEVPEEVTEQVSKMDLIYRCSEVTIIGATGQGAEDGLPGVRKERVVKQPHGRVGKHFFVSSMQDPTWAIRTSKWWTRGWTYQEGLLARRRLIFTDQQVYFECGGMYCCEALNFNLSNLHTKDGQRFKSQFRQGVNLGLFPARLGYSPWEVVERIIEYSNRTLRMPSDALNGVIGVLQALEGSRMRLHHFFGVPLLPRAPKPRVLDYYTVLAKQWTNEPCEWSLTAGFCVGLAWRAEKQLQRQASFPSWSWAGWAAPVREEWTRPVKWAMTGDDWRDFEVDSSLELRVHLEDGQVLDWDAFHRDYDKLKTKASSTLDVRGWMTPVRVRVSKHRGPVVQVFDSDFEFVLEWRRDYAAERDYSTERDLTDFVSDTLSALHLGRNSSRYTGFCQYVLLLRLAGPDYWERVGFGRWTLYNLEDPKGRHINLEASDPQGWWKTDWRLPVGKLMHSFRLA